MRISLSAILFFTAAYSYPTTSISAPSTDDVDRTISSEEEDPGYGMNEECDAFGLCFDDDDDDTGFKGETPGGLGYGMDEEDDGLAARGIPAIDPADGFVCGAHMATYVSFRDRLDTPSNVRCVKFFRGKENASKPHIGFFWYGEGYSNNAKKFRQIGRYTEGRVRKDVVIGLPMGRNMAPSMTTANFNVSMINYDSSTFDIDVPYLITFVEPFYDRWIHVPNGVAPFKRTTRPTNKCGRNFVRFFVYAKDDKFLKTRGGFRCMSKSYLSWYGTGRWGDNSYMHVATTADSSSRWNAVYGAGLPMTAADVCEDMSFCGEANIRLKRLCIARTGYRGPGLEVPEWNEIWVPDMKSEESSRETFGLGEC